MALLQSVELSFNNGSSSSCKAKHGVVARLLQEYLDKLQDSLEMDRVSYGSLTEKGGVPDSIDDGEISKWWMLFWERQPLYWLSLKRVTGKDNQANRMLMGP